MRRIFGKGIGLWAWISLSVLACLAGCGKSEGTEGASQEGIVKKERTEYDLGTGQWKEYKEVGKPNEGWVVVDYWEDSGLNAPDPSMNEWHSCRVMDGTDFYIVQEYGIQDSEGNWSQKYYMKHIDMAAGKEEMLQELDLSGGAASTGELQEAIAAGRMMLQGANVLDGKISLFLMEYDSENQRISHAYVVWLDSEKKPEKLMDLEPELKQSGILEDKGGSLDFLCDRDDQLYFYNYREAAVFGSDGKLIKKLGQSSDTGVMMQTGRLPDGRPIFENVDHESDKTVIFCFEDGKEKILYQGKYSYVSSRYLNEYGEIYYIDQKKLVRWDAGTGTCDQIYEDASMKAENCKGIMEDVSDGSIMLIFHDNETLYRLKLRQEPDREETEITVYQLFESDKIEKYADKYTQTHPGTKVTVVTANQEDDRDIALNKLMVQVQEGKGPDLIVPFVWQLETLQSQDMLMDLSEVMPEELLENIFGGVLQNGTIDGRLYGMYINAYASTLAVSKEIWQGETWTPEDVMKLMESGGKDGKGFESFMGGESADSLLFYLAGKDIMAGSSSLVDQEKKQCYFDSEYFIGILEFCKRHGAETGSYMGTEEKIEGMHGGKMLACTVGSYANLASFTKDLEMLGDNFHCVGYPTEGGYGGYVSAMDCIAMNASTEHQETALDFIKYLLSEKVQREIGITTVRRDVLVKNVRGALREGDSAAFMLGKRAITPLGTRSDGSSFLPEYLEVMEKGCPDPVMYDELMCIVSEEAASFFQGDKTAEEAAEVIQSRVDLYLNAR